MEQDIYAEYDNEDISEATIKSENSNSRVQESDIYNDLQHTDLGERVVKLTNENENLQEKLKQKDKDIEKLCQELLKMKQTENNLKKNISALYNTSKLELQRKNKAISDIRRELDNLLFRRSNALERSNTKRPRHENRDDDHGSKRFKEDVYSTRDKSCSQDDRLQLSQAALKEQRSSFRNTERSNSREKINYEDRKSLHNASGSRERTSSCDKNKNQERSRSREKNETRGRGGEESKRDNKDKERSVNYKSRESALDLRETLMNRRLKELQYASRRTSEKSTKDNSEKDGRKNIKDLHKPCNNSAVDSRDNLQSVIEIHDVDDEIIKVEDIIVYGENIKEVSVTSNSNKKLKETKSLTSSKVHKKDSGKGIQTIIEIHDNDEIIQGDKVTVCSKDNKEDSLINGSNRKLKEAKNVTSTKLHKQNSRLDKTANCLEQNSVKIDLKPSRNVKSDSVKANNSLPDLTENITPIESAKEEANMDNTNAKNQEDSKLNSGDFNQISATTSSSEIQEKETKPSDSGTVLKDEEINCNKNILLSTSMPEIGSVLSLQNISSTASDLCNNSTLSITEATVQVTEISKNSNLSKEEVPSSGTEQQNETVTENITKPKKCSLLENLSKEVVPFSDMQQNDTMIENNTEPNKVTLDRNLGKEILCSDIQQQNHNTTEKTEPKKYTRRGRKRCIITLIN